MGRWGYALARGRDNSMGSTLFGAFTPGESVYRKRLASSP
jgi:hypothetical protein